MNYNENFIEKKHLFNEQKVELAVNQVKTVDNLPIQKSLSLTENLANYEKAIIEKTLQKNNGNKTKTASDLQISIRGLYYKMERLGIREQ